MDILGWLPIVIAILVALASSNQKHSGKSGSKYPQPWARGFGPRRYEQPQTTAVRKSTPSAVSQPLAENRKNAKTTGIERIPGDERISGVEETPGVKGISVSEEISGISGTEGIAGRPSIPPIHSLEENWSPLPSPEALQQAVLWSEILAKPRALRPWKRI